MITLFIYNCRSMWARWPTLAIAVFGIASTTCVFIASLALENGFRTTLVASGSRQNILVRRAGATSENDSMIDLDQIREVESAPGLAYEGNEPLSVSEAVVIGSFPLKSGTNANIQLRGTEPNVLQVREGVKMQSGRLFQPGTREMIVGRNVPRAYRGLQMGSIVKFAGQSWNIVGVFDGGGSTFDSEIWCDRHVLNGVYRRSDRNIQSATLRLVSPSRFHEFYDWVEANPSFTMQVQRERDFYEQQSHGVVLLISVLGAILAITMAIGAILGAANMIHLAEIARLREFAILQAIGFRRRIVIFCVTCEALLLALSGTVAAIVLVLPLNALTVGTISASFSRVEFAFRTTPAIMFRGFIFCTFIALLSAIWPAISACRQLGHLRSPQS